MSNDLRYAIRMLRKSPGFAITAVCASTKICRTPERWEAMRDHATTVDVALLSGISARVDLVTGDQALPSCRIASAPGRLDPISLLRE